MPSQNTPSNASRRTFLKASAAAAAAAFASAPVLHAEPAPVPWPENGTLIPDTGWHLWVDRDAQWKNDPLFLPEDVRPGGPGDLATLPVHPPTGGWDRLRPTTPDTIPVTLPATVEQHLWGAYGAGPDAKSRPYTPDEYRYAADDPVPQNGAWFGVSWWYRDIDVPASLRGKRLFLHIRGAHLRAEVFLNRKLVGYSIMEELPFECDLTHAADPGGENLLAIRVTNPFGRFDWVDGLNAQWGAVKLYRSHGFGGLDRGMTLSSHASDRIVDAWLLNTPRPRRAKLCCILERFDHTAPQVVQGQVSVEVIDRQSGALIGSSSLSIDNFDEHTAEAIDGSKEQAARMQRANKAYLASPEAAFRTPTNSLEFDVPKAVLWNLDAPQLYDVVITWTASNGASDTRTIPFGFRTFTSENVSSKTANALFRLNGRRIRLYSSISWGFWGLNGMWPTPELAEKEVTQAKKLNLNCLNFHRNLAKEDVLRAHDRLGLLRYMEPGAGKFSIGKLPANAQANAASIVMDRPTDPADRFAQRFMFTKCVAMVKAFRSHPSVIIYCLQNELGADLANPDTLAVLAAMRAEDPSRLIVLNDGFVAPPRKAAQAFYEPWNPHLHRSDQEPWGAWWNQHQGAGDQWYDEFYKSPTDFTYAAPPFPGTLTEYGEMEGCATPDNHALMLHQHAAPPATGLGQQPANKSYDHADHAEIDAAYNAFLDRWNFRAAFPSTEQLYLSLGKKCYDTWQNYLENARISNDLDFAVISGWESTSIENHSGIVDNLRNFKSDPSPIAGTLQPIRPVAKQRSLCTAFGQPATFDLFLLNDTSVPATGTLEFTAVTPSNKLLKLASLPAPQQMPDVFSYLLHEAFQTPPLTEEGLYRFKFALSSSPQSTHTKEIWVAKPLSYNPAAGRPFKIGVSGISPALRKQLGNLGPLFSVDAFTPGGHYSVIVSSGLTSRTTDHQESGDTTGLEAQPAARPAVPGRKLEPGEAAEPVLTGHLEHGILEAVQAGTPLLAIPQTDTLSEGLAKQLAQAGAFTYHGTVGDFRAPWMGNWYFVRKHPVYAGLPVDQAMGIHFQARGRQSNGLLVEGPNVEVTAAYSRDHDRNIGAGTFTTRLNSTKVLYHRVPELHPVLQQRFLANAIAWLTTP